MGGQRQQTSHAASDKSLRKHGLFDVVIFPNVFERIRRDMRGRSGLVFEGVVQQGEGGATVIADAVQPLQR